MHYTNENKTGKQQRFPWPEVAAKMNPGTDDLLCKAVACLNLARKHLWDWSQGEGRPIALDGFDDMNEREFLGILSDIEESIDNVVDLHALSIKYAAFRTDFTIEKV